MLDRGGKGESSTVSLSQLIQRGIIMLVRVIANAVKCERLESKSPRDTDQRGKLLEQHRRRYVESC